MIDASIPLATKPFADVYSDVQGKIQQNQKIQSNDLGIQQQQLTLASAKVDRALALASSATPDNYAQVRAQAIQELGPNVESELPPVYDPNAINSIRMNLMPIKDKLALQQTMLLRQIQSGRLGVAENSLNEKVTHDTAIETGNGRSSGVGRMPVPADTSAQLSGDILQPPAVGGKLPNPNMTNITSPAQLHAGTLRPPPVRGQGGLPNPGAVSPDLSNLQGMDYVKARGQTDPARANRILALANGEQPLPTARGKTHDPILDETNTAFPGVSNARNKAYMDYFGGGKPQQAVNALNTAIGHAGELADKIEALHSSDIYDSPVTNPMANKLTTLSGNPKVTNFQAVVQPLSHEIERLYNGASGGTGAQLENQMKVIGDANASKEQQVGALREVINLMASKTNAYKEQYDSSMQGAPSPRQFVPIGPHAQQVIQRIVGSTGNNPGISTIPHGAIDAELQKRGVK